MCKISIVIPVYNVEQYIQACLESIQNQTFEDFEALFINDGSKQNEKEIILKYVNNDNRFKYIEKENGGQGSARNLGVREAKGEFVFFLDSDDYIASDCLAKLYQNAISTQSDVVLCDYFIVENNVETYKESNKLYTEDYKKNYVLNASSPCFKLIRKDVILKGNLFFPEGIVYEDVAVMGAYILYTDKISYVHEALYYYVMRDGSTMNQIRYNKKLENVFPALENLSKRFEQSGKEEYKMELEYIYISHMLHNASLRFFEFTEGKKHLNRIVETMRNRYPKWMRNKYYKNESWKYKIVTTLFYYKVYFVLNMILK